MQGKYCCRLTLLGFLVSLALLTGSAIASAEGREPGVICEDLPGTIGLVMDSRGNAYTVSRATGQVLCVPPGEEPMVYARVDDTPTVLAVDSLRTVFVGTESGGVYAVMLDGSVSRVHTCDSRVSGLDIDRDGSLIVVTGRGAIIKVEREDFIWKD